MTEGYIDPKLPSIIRGLLSADASERSVQTILDLAADLVQELIDLRTPKPYARHNHPTRDIKPLGQCPACDEYHNRNQERA